ncbi:CFEM domain-containing protein [Colletotrichum plurivorum]|uniref:CFEM domain-containing protein n=1 Tax=Colletotrichum plurivorum TaxID=2175906 RepID=A0A8H6K3A6_9PEZI|nr:CFEM domain-containing protein [Colletotrichum plurivorum]
MGCRVLFDVCSLPVRDKGTSATVCAVAGAFIAIMSVAIREYSQLSRLDYNIGLDDYALIFTMVMSVPMSVLVCVTVQSGLGKDIWTLTPNQINEFFKLFYISEHFYAFTVLFAKTNFLFFYLRLFADKKFRRFTWLVIWACIVSAVCFFFATMFQCWPISYTWTRWDGEHQGRCHDINLQTWIHASVNITLDVVVVGMPISQIVRLNWRWKQKLGAGMMFAVALLITLVSVVRLNTINDFMKTSNPTWDIVPISNWSFFELNGFIFCSCMPAFRDYFRRVFRRRRRTIMDASIANRAQMRTVGDHPVPQVGHLGELVSMDSDEPEPEHTLEDLSQVDLGVGRLSVGVADPNDENSLTESPVDIAEVHEEPDEMDLADLQHLGTLVSTGGWVVPSRYCILRIVFLSLTTFPR